MAKASSRPYKSRPLVGGFLERISSDAFSRYPKELTDLVGKQHGVYALYKKDHLYYVGLATNLRTRINHHLKDRHAGKWDRFSLYLVHKADHIKEIESLLLRIADPKGNTTSGHLKAAENLRNELKAKVKRAEEREIDRIFGTPRSKPAKPARKRVATASARARAAWRTRRKKGPSVPLAPYVTKRLTLHGTYKGREYTAWVRSSGNIHFDGKLYNSPSVAATAVTGNSANGWWFWRYHSPDGTWLRLRELRHKA